MTSPQPPKQPGNPFVGLLILLAVAVVLLSPAIANISNSH